MFFIVVALRIVIIAFCEMKIKIHTSPFDSQSQLARQIIASNESFIFIFNSLSLITCGWGCRWCKFIFILSELNSNTVETCRYHQGFKELNRKCQVSADYLGDPPGNDSNKAPLYLIIRQCQHSCSHKYELGACCLLAASTDIISIHLCRCPQTFNIDKDMIEREWDWDP